MGTRYRVIREVARGGMGRIWEVEDTELGRRVALKVQPPWENASARLLQCESRILGTLEHSGIVLVQDAGVLRNGRVGAPPLLCRYHGFELETLVYHTHRFSIVITLRLTAAAWLSTEPT